MILGTGIDIAEFERIEAVLQRNPKLCKRILTPMEMGQLPSHPRRKVEYLSGRFAAKEAFSKALGVGIGSAFSWHDISIWRGESGKAEVIFHHQQFLDSQWKNRKVHLSISHERKYVIAFVIIEGI